MQQRLSFQQTQTEQRQRATLKVKFSLSCSDMAGHRVGNDRSLRSRCGRCLVEQKGGGGGKMEEVLDSSPLRWQVLRRRGNGVSLYIDALPSGAESSQSGNCPGEYAAWSARNVESPSTTDSRSSKVP